MDLFIFGFSVVLCLAISNVYANVIDPTQQTNIVPVKTEEFPFLASVGNCGAAILSEEWVVTVSQCVTNFPDPEKSFVRVGGNKFQSGSIVEYDEVFKYPTACLAEKSVPVDDIALIHLHTPLNFSESVNKVDLPTYEISPHQDLVYVGREKKTGMLKKIDIINLSIEECFSYFPEEYKKWDVYLVALDDLEVTNICAKKIFDDPSFCDFYIGSPVVQKNTLVGLASFIDNHCENSGFAYFVNVDSYVSWIKEVTGL